MQPNSPTRETLLNELTGRGASFSTSTRCPARQKRDKVKGCSARWTRAAVPGAIRGWLFPRLATVLGKMPPVICFLLWDARRVTGRCIVVWEELKLSASSQYGLFRSRVLLILFVSYRQSSPRTMFKLL